VENEISDCKATMSFDEWVEQCQIIMKANTGMNFFGFFALLQNVVVLRIALLKNHEELNINVKSESVPVSDFTDYDKRIVFVQTLIRGFQNNLDDSFKFTSKNLEKNCLKAIIDLVAILKVLSDLIEVFKDKFNGLIYNKNEKFNSYKNSSNLFKKVAVTLNRILQYIISNS